MKALSKKVVLGVAVLAASGIAYAAPVTVNIVGNSGSGSTGVAVSATVAPILTMDISTGALNLGALTSAGYSAAQSLDIEIATNANGGASVTAASANGGLKGTAASGNHVLNNLDASLPNEGYRIVSVADVGTADLKSTSSRTGLALAQIADTSAKTVYSVNGPERADATPDAVVSIDAQADAATPADSYSDVVTFTVAATF